MEVSEYTGSAADWTAFLEQNRGGFLATQEWANFKSRHGWKSTFLQVVDGKTIRLLSTVLTRQMPLGYVFYYSFESPIVLGGDWNVTKNQQAFEALHKYLQAKAKQEKCLFYKIDPHQSVEEFPVSWLNALGYHNSVEDIQAPVVAHVDLSPTEEEILARMKQSGRRHVRQAEKNGVTVTHGHEPTDLETFYRLHETTAKRQHITYRSKRYFEEMREDLMVGSDHATFFTGWHEGKAISSILVTVLGDESVYLYGGNDIQDRNLYASYLVQWEAMKYAKQQGTTFYNMTGVSQTDDPNDAWAGLRQFKLKFGSDVVRLVSARDYPYQPLAYQAFTQADRVRRKVAKLLNL